MNSAPALELGVRVQRTGGSTCGSSRHHWLATWSRGLDSLHNWLAASEGGGRGPVVRIGRVQEEEEAMCSSTSGLLPALWLPAHRTEILDKSGTIAVPPINLLDRLISLPHN